MIQKTLKSATLWQYNYDTNAEAATVCIPNMYETASLQKADFGNAYEIEWSLSKETMIE